MLTYLLRTGVFFFKIFVLPPRLMSFVVVVVISCFFDRASLCNPGKPGNYYVNQTGL